MTKKKEILLDLPSIVELGTTGKCEIFAPKGKFVVGSTYPLVHYENYLVKVEKMYLKNGRNCLELSMEQVKKRNNVAQVKGSMRKVQLLKVFANGAFVGKRDKYELGEELAVAEAYHFIYERLMQEDKESGVEFMHRVADEHRVDVEKVRSLAAWFNADKVVAELMPRRIKIVEAFTVKAQEIVPELWAEMGLKWISEEFEYQKKKQYIGPSKWNANSNVIVYRYSLMEE